MMKKILLLGLLALGACSIQPTPGKCQGSLVKGCHPTLYFDFNSDKLTSESLDTLDWPIQKLKKRGQKRVSVSGYADQVGGRKVNLEISKKRAIAVRDYLIKNSITPERIDIYYYGKDLLRTTDENKQYLERRVEIKIIDEEDKFFGRY